MTINKEVLENTMVKELMSHIGEHDFAKTQSSYFDVANLISKNNIGSLMILGDDNRLFGIVTDGDLRRTFNNNGPIPLFMLTASEFMTKNPTSCLETDTIGHVLRTMQNPKKMINIMPIVDESQKLVGYVTMHVFVSWMLEKIYQ